MDCSEVKRWLRSCGYWVSAGAPKGAGALTHVFLDGGRASVPLSERSTGLMRAYHADVCAGRRVCLVERTLKGGTYRMFADFDKVEGDVGLVRRALERVPGPLRGGGGEARVAVCSRVDGDGEGGKMGFHLIWNDACRVDDDGAVALRDAWVSALDHEDPLAEGSWGAIVDAAVYRRNGLRMPWSMKRHGGSYYAPTHEATFSPAPGPGGDVILTPVRISMDGDVLNWLGRCSIAAWHPMDEADGMRSSFSTGVSLDARGPKRVTVAREEGRTRPGATARGCFVCALTRDDLAQIRAALPRDKYGDDVSLGATLWNATKTAVIVACSSRYCHLVERSHSSNHVFFEVSRRTGKVVQRCHSQACVGKRHELGTRTARPLSVFSAASPSLIPSTCAQASARWLALVVAPTNADVGAAAAAAAGLGAAARRGT